MTTYYVSVLATVEIEIIVEVDEADSEDEALANAKGYVEGSLSASAGNADVVDIDITKIDASLQE